MSSGFPLIDSSTILAMKGQWTASSALRRAVVLPRVQMLLVALIVMPVGIALGGTAGRWLVYVGALLLLSAAVGTGRWWGHLKTPDAKTGLSDWSDL
jgi:hypothetical protein